MLEDLLRGVRLRAERVLRAWTEAEDVWDLDDPFLDGAAMPIPKAASIYD